MINVHDKVRMATELYRFKQNRNYENVDPETIQVFDSEDEDLAPGTILETIDTAKYRIVDVQEKLYRLKEVLYNLSFFLNLFTVYLFDF